MFQKIVVLALSSVMSMNAFSADIDSSCENPENITLEPVVKWHWQGSSVMPYHNQVMSMPIVVPLEDTNGDGQINQDDIPSVVFNTFSGGNYGGNGVLRAVSGQDGHELWTITNSAYRTNPGSTIAAADIDSDGKVEIVSVKSGRGIIAFEHTGQFKWQNSHTVSSRANISVADLEGDGQADIVVGNTVFNHDGSTKWQVSSNYVLYGDASIADLNSNGQQEVIIGGSAYSAQGKLLWQNSAVGRGFAAVGNFDADDYPEIVVSGNGKVSLLSHTGKLIWQSYIPSGGGGAPTIADMDGDNKPEIGVAGAYYYVVFNTDGSILWQSRTQDTSSRITGSSVFDFNGDGQAEVVYNDEQHLRIYRGTDGQELFKMRNTSGTLLELPVITDLDKDGHADIIVASNSYYALGVNTGIIALQGKNNDWMNTRSIWNQHSYHITNVNDDGTIPRQEKPSWLHSNTYRSIPYLSASGKTCVRQAACQIYGVQDSDVNNSQFITVSAVPSLEGFDVLRDIIGQLRFSMDEFGNPHIDNLDSIDIDTKGFSVKQLLSYQINKLGSEYKGYDIEAMAVHPQTNIIYAASGNDTLRDLPKGHLYALDGQIGKLHPIGPTGFKEIGDLTFSPSGILYGYAKGAGIITIDIETGKGELWIASEQMVEGLALSKAAGKNVFYGTADQDLWEFNIDTGELAVKCNNLPGEIEALEVLQDDELMFTIHHGKQPYIYFMDARDCDISSDIKISLGKFNDVEGLTMPNASCGFMSLP